MADDPGFFERGDVYKATLDEMDIRIAVTGIRGKSSTVRRLHDVFYDRGYDTFAKVTGDHPLTIHNGESEPIQRRGAQTTLYENRDLLSKAIDRLVASAFDGKSAAIFENHAISEYTMRVFNETLLDPHVVVVPNVRTDHTETLGRSRQNITRSFARSIPADTHVISGEANDAVHGYLAEQLRARGVTVSRVDVPEQYRDLPGAESVLAINHVLEAVGEPPLSDQQVEQRLADLRPSWLHLEAGARAFNAAKVNEPESTELFRRLLAGDDDPELVCPFVFLRTDRRGRTAAFANYLNDLYERGCIDRAHAAGANVRTFAKRVDPPVTVHEDDPEAAVDVLDAVLAEDQPLMTMANTVHPFMRAFVTEMEGRVRSEQETPAVTND